MRVCARNELVGRKIHGALYGNLLITLRRTDLHKKDRKFQNLTLDFDECVLVYRGVLCAFRAMWVS